MVGDPSANAYRIPFAIQWIWPIPLIVGVYLAPESPWWLVRHGKEEEAKHSLRRLAVAGNDEYFDLDKTIAMIKHTNKIEKEFKAGTRYLDCFLGTDLRRTEISAIVWMIQSVCGSTFIGYSTVFFEQAGLPTKAAFDMSMAQYSLAAIGTILSWFMMSYVGRRHIYLYGTAALTTLLFIIGMIGIAPRGGSASWAVGSMILVFAFTYDLTVGPVCYSLVSEISSTRLRAKTIVLARNLYNIAGIIVNVLTNYMLTPTAWNWGAKAAFFWMGSCALCCLWTFFRLPEPKGRSYGELDVLFQQKVPARRFRHTIVDPFRDDAASATEDTAKAFDS